MTAWSWDLCLLTVRPGMGWWDIREGLWAAEDTLDALNSTRIDSAMTSMGLTHRQRTVGAELIPVKQSVLWQVRGPDLLISWPISNCHAGSLAVELGGDTYSQLQHTTEFP